MAPSDEPQVELVVCPPWVTQCPHLALAYLSTFLRTHGVRTRVRDLNAELRHRIEPDQRRYWDLTSSNFWSRPRLLNGVFSPASTRFLSEFIDSLLESPAPILGFSCQSANVNFTLSALELLRQRGCEKLIVVGGPSVRLQVPLDPRSLGLIGFRPGRLDDQDSEVDLAGRLDLADVYVDGEGEETLLEVVRAHLSGAPLTGIPGAIAWTGGGREVAYVPRPTQPELDRFPPPTFEEFDLSIYDLPRLPFLTSRGCVRKCAMCYERILWPGFRHRSVDHIVRELRQHVERHGIRQFSCNDLLLNANLPHLGALCDAVAASGLDVEWWGNAVVHRLMDAELFRRMRRGGISALLYGIESGSQKILRKMRKGYLVGDADKVLELGAGAGIRNIINLIAGFPGETEEDHGQTLDFVRRNHDHIHMVGVLATCLVYPQSPLAEHPEEYGIEPASLEQLNPFSVNTSWRDTQGLDEATRNRRFWELHNLIRGYGIPVDGVEDEEELTPARVDELCTKLTDPIVWVREDAVSRLGSSRDRRLVPRLAAMLDDESDFVVERALLGISALDPERGWREAARLIRRRAPQVDWAAMIALAAVDRPDTFDYLEGQLRSGAWRRADSRLRGALGRYRADYEPLESFSEALARAESPEPLGLLEHGSSGVRLRTLAEMLGHPGVWDPAKLVEAGRLASSDACVEVRYQALELMLSADVRRAETLSSGCSDAAPRVRALATQRAGEYAATLSEKDYPEELRPIFAAWERAALGDWPLWLGEAPTASEREYRSLVVSRRLGDARPWSVCFIEWALGCPYESVRVAVLEHLASRRLPGHDEAALAQLAHPSPRVRALACQYLASTGDRRHELRLAALLSDPDLKVFFGAVAALGNLVSPLVHRLLGERLEPSVYARLPLHAQEGLARCKALLERTRSLAASMRSGDEETMAARYGQACAFEKVCLLETMEQTRTVSRFAGIVSRALTAVDAEVRRRALAAVVSCGDRGFALHVLPMTRDVTPWFRATACRFLATIRSREAQARFREMLQDSEPGVREWAARGLGRLQDPEALAALAPLLSDSVFHTLTAELREDLAFHRELACAGIASERTAPATNRTL